MAKKLFDIEQLNEQYGEQIAKDYLNGSFAKDLAERYLGKKSFYRYIFLILEKQGVKRRTRSENKILMDKVIENENFNARRYTLNENYFKTWSPDMAYILGLIATDGNVFDRRVLKIQLQIKDIDILEKIKEQLNFSGNINLRKNIIGDKTFLSAELCIYSTPLVHSLEELNIFSNKSLTIGRFDFIPEEYELDFIRGVIDGDGSIGESNNSKSSRSVQMRLRIFSGSLTFIEYIQDIMEKHGFGRPKCSIEKRKHTYYSLCYSTVSAVKFFQDNYKNSNLHIERKYKAFSDLIERRKEYEEANKNSLKLVIN